MYNAERTLIALTLPQELHLSTGLAQLANFQKRQSVGLVSPHEFRLMHRFLLDVYVLARTLPEADPTMTYISWATSTEGTKHTIIRAMETFRFERQRVSYGGGPYATVRIACIGVTDAPFDRTRVCAERDADRPLLYGSPGECRVHRSWPLLDMDKMNVAYEWVWTFDLPTVVAHLGAAR